MLECGCPVSLCINSEDVGFLYVQSDGYGGIVTGLHKNDVAIRGIREAAGLLWYAGNSEIGALADMDGLFREIVTVPADEWFGTDTSGMNIALIAALYIGEGTVFVAAVAYMGNGRFLYVSKYIYIDAVFASLNPAPPSNSFIFDAEEQEASHMATEFIDLTRVRVVAHQDSVRRALYAYVKSDLQRIGKSVPQDGFVDVGRAYDGRLLYLHENGSLSLEDGAHYSYSGAAIDQSNPYSNLLVSIFFDRTISCLRKHAISINGYIVPVSGFLTTACYPLKRGMFRIVSVDSGALFEFAHNSSYAAGTCYHSEALRLVLNSPQGNLLEFMQFIVPGIPNGMLSGQTQNINAAISVAQPVQYRS